MTTTLENFETAWKEFDQTGNNYLLRIQLETFLETLEKISGTKLLSESDKIMLRRYSPQYAFEKIQKEDVPRTIESYLDTVIFQGVRPSISNTTTSPSPSASSLYKGFERPLESIMKSPEQLRRSPKSQLPIAPRSPMTPRCLSESRLNSSDELNDIPRRSPAKQKILMTTNDDMEFINDTELGSMIQEQRNGIQKIFEENVYLKQRLEDVIKGKNLNLVLYDSIKKKARLQELKIKSLENQLKGYELAENHFEDNYEEDLKFQIENNSTKETRIFRIFQTLRDSDIWSIITPLILLFTMLFILSSLLVYLPGQINLMSSLIINTVYSILKWFNDDSVETLKKFNNDWTYDDLVTSSELDFERIINYGRRNN
ncbi:hypothetical protein WICPIJ_002219 [Wickerhamomyces pijperi]|uniref:EF-hand domain-containing protein n=1 Tax=Wickerhamomyces pijperi TaxID=599730 RepID=A0A9P8QA49_WICPI|nr:hypothetical protein WICPIJ_002219 [Wickerhamomyces pijperi]